jgi:hypothetical protein
VHSQFFERLDFFVAANPAGGCDRQSGEAAEFSEPREIRALHRSFAVHIGEFRTVRLKLGNGVVRPQREPLPPGAHNNMSRLRVYGEDYILATHALAQWIEKTVRYVAAAGLIVNEIGGARKSVPIFRRPAARNPQSWGNSPRLIFRL